MASVSLRIRTQFLNWVVLVVLGIDQSVELQLFSRQVSDPPRTATLQHDIT